MIPGSLLTEAMFNDLPSNLTPQSFEKIKEKLPEKVEQAENFYWI